MKVGDLVRVARKYDFVGSYLEDVEVYSAHPTSSIQSITDVHEVRVGEIGVIIEMFAVPGGDERWMNVLFSRSQGWIDSEHIEVAERYKFAE